MELQGGIALGPPFSVNGAPTFHRAIIGGHLLESTSYTRNSRRNNFSVRTSRGLAIVEDFVAVKGILTAHVLFLQPVGAPSSICPTVRQYKTANRDQIAASDILEGPLDTVKRHQDYFVVDFPLHLEGN